MTKGVKIDGIAKMLKRGRAVAPTPPKPANEEAAEPTPERRRRGRFVLEAVHDTLPGGRVSLRGKAFRNQPKFETIEGLGSDQLRALRKYRETFDRSEQSGVRCALDFRPRGTGGGFNPEPTVAIANARSLLKAFERDIGPIVDTLRDVALNDLTFRELAMKRFGSREVAANDAGKGKRKSQQQTNLEPKSGRHRQIIRDEFMQAVARLEQAVRPYMRTGDGDR